MVHGVEPLLTIHVHVCILSDISDNQPANCDICVPKEGRVW